MGWGWQGGDCECCGQPGCNIPDGAWSVESGSWSEPTAGTFQSSSEGGVILFTPSEPLNEDLHLAVRGMFSSPAFIGASTYRVGVLFRYADMDNHTRIMLYREPVPGFEFDPRSKLQFTLERMTDGVLEVLGETPLREWRNATIASSGQYEVSAVEAGNYCAFGNPNLLHTPGTGYNTDLYHCKWSPSDGTYTPQKSGDKYGIYIESTDGTLQFTHPGGAQNGTLLGTRACYPTPPRIGHTRGTIQGWCEYNDTAPKAKLSGISISGYSANDYPLNANVLLDSGGQAWWEENQTAIDPNSSVEPGGLLGIGGDNGIIVWGNWNAPSEETIKVQQYNFSPPNYPGTFWVWNRKQIRVAAVTADLNPFDPALNPQFLPPLPQTVRDGAEEKRFNAFPAEYIRLWARYSYWVQVTASDSGWNMSGPFVHLVYVGSKVRLSDIGSNSGPFALKKYATYISAAPDQIFPFEGDFPAEIFLEFEE